MALPEAFPFRDLSSPRSRSSWSPRDPGDDRPAALEWLGVHDDGTVEREVRLARIEALRAAVEAVQSSSGGDAAELLRRRYELRLRHAEQSGDAGDLAQDAAVIRVAATAERQRLIELRELLQLAQA